MGAYRRPIEQRADCRVRNTPRYGHTWYMHRCSNPEGSEAGAFAGYEQSGTYGLMPLFETV